MSSLLRLVSPNSGSFESSACCWSSCVTICCEFVDGWSGPGSSRIFVPNSESASGACFSSFRKLDRAVLIVYCGGDALSMVPEWDWVTRFSIGADSVGAGNGSFSSPPASTGGAFGCSETSVRADSSPFVSPGACYLPSRFPASYGSVTEPCPCTPEIGSSPCATCGVCSPHIAFFPESMILLTVSVPRGLDDVESFWPQRAL